MSPTDPDGVANAIPDFAVKISGHEETHEENKELAQLGHDLPLGVSFSTLGLNENQ